MKAKIFSGVLLAAGLSLVSCKKEETVETAVKPVPSVYEILNGNKVTATPPPPVQVQQNPTAVPQTASTAAQAAPVPVGKGMNPSHGQPGHRCDIPVGAPLNSPPGKTTAQPQKAQPTGKALVTQTTMPNTTTANNTAIPQTISAPVTVAPGMNPPHGQEGHRCDIAVGAPLSKTEEKKEEIKQ